MKNIKSQEAEQQTDISDTISHAWQGAILNIFSRQKNQTSLATWCLFLVITPVKTDMAIKNQLILNRRYILKWLVFQCDVSFPGCTSP